jgi:hypothetical protein
MSINHTSTPWVSRDEWNSKEGIVEILATNTEGEITNPTRGLVAMAAWRGDRPEDIGQAKANAAFIVRACNAHYDLLAGIARLKAFLEDEDVRIQTKSLPMDMEFGSICSAIDAAVAKAKGE